MKRSITLVALVLSAFVFVFAQRRGPQAEQPNAALAHTQYDLLSVFPREVSPGQYEQVDQRELRSVAAEGWELVGVTPFVYRNEEHYNGEMHGPKPVITQTYPAYFFKRPRLTR